MKYINDKKLTYEQIIALPILNVIAYKKNGISKYKFDDKILNDANFKEYIINKMTELDNDFEYQCKYLYSDDLINCIKKLSNKEIHNNSLFYEDQNKIVSMLKEIKEEILKELKK